MEIPKMKTLNSKLSTLNCLYIGDSLVDAATAKAANLPFVACAWGFCTEEQLRSADVQHLIHHPVEILSFVD